MGEEARPRSFAGWRPRISLIFDAVVGSVLTMWIIGDLNRGELVWGGVLIGALIGVVFGWVFNSPIVNSPNDKNMGIAALLSLPFVIAAILFVVAWLLPDSWLTRVVPSADITFIESAGRSVIAASFLTQVVFVAIGWVRSSFRGSG